MAFQSLIQMNLGNSLSKSWGKLGIPAGRTASVERGQSHVCQILLIFSDQELEAYTAQSLAPGPHQCLCRHLSYSTKLSITFWHYLTQHVITVKSVN